MIGFMNRVLVLIFGYVYPAYECYKCVEMNKPSPEHLRFWCQYWILVAFLMACESVGDVFFGWIPMYSEAKLGFFIFLWYPKTKGSKYIYESFLRPLIAKHEKDIDRHLLELKTRAGDLVFFYWRRSAGYVQIRIFDILRYITSQAAGNQPAEAKQNADKSTASSTNQKEATEARPSETTPMPPQTPNARKDAEEQMPQVDPATPSSKTVADEAGPLSRARLRRVNTPTKY